WSFTVIVATSTIVLFTYSRISSPFQQAKWPRFPPELHSCLALDFEFLHAVSKVVAADSECAGGFGLVPVIFAEGLNDEGFFVAPKGGLGLVASVGEGLFADDLAGKM